MEAPQPRVGFWLDLRVVLVQRSRPGPLGEGIGETILQTGKHFVSDDKRGIRGLMRLIGV